MEGVSHGLQHPGTEEGDRMGGKDNTHHSQKKYAPQERSESLHCVCARACPGCVQERTHVGSYWSASRFLCAQNVTWTHWQEGIHRATGLATNTIRCAVSFWFHQSFDSDEQSMFKKEGGGRGT